LRLFSFHIAKAIFVFCTLFLFTTSLEAQIRERRPVNDTGFPPADDGFGNFPQDPFATDSLNQRVDSTGQLIFENTDTINFRKVVREFDLNLERTEPEFTLDDVHLYQEADQQDEPSVHMGINGSAIGGLTNNFDYSPGVSSGLTNFDAYKILDDEVKYYSAQRPFTKMFFAAGSERENRFKLEHSQNWGRGLNVGFDYQRLVSEGFYQNQEIDHNNIAVHAWYQGKNKHFNSMVHYISNKFLNDANGGIVDTVGAIDYYSDEDFNRRQSIPVYLPTSRSRFKGRTLNVQNSYDLGKLVDVQINDTITDKQLISRFRVQHTLNINNEDHNYFSDARDALFYEDAFFNVEGTADSLFFNKLGNEFRIKWLGNKLGSDSTFQRTNFLADAYARFEAYEVEFDGNFAAGNIFEEDFTDLAVGGSFRSNPLDTALLIYKAEGAVHLADYRQGDYYVKGELGVDLKNAAGSLVAFLELNNQEQYYVAQRFESNHYSLNNDLDKTNARTIGGIYSNDVLNFEGSVRFTNVTNALWYNEERAPTIDGDAESYVLVHARKAFNYGKFTSEFDGWYQTTSDEESLGQPAFLGSASTFYKGGLFKNKVISKIGLRATYYSPFEYNAYDPALGQFYAETRRYENLPELGFFSNFQLSRARLFLRLDNLASFARDEPIFPGKDLPHHDFAFRTGINWVFVN